MMRSDIYKVFQACVTGTLHEVQPLFYTDRSAVAVVTVSHGYPASYKKGMPVTGTVKRSISYRTTVNQFNLAAINFSILKVLSIIH